MSFPSKKRRMELSCDNKDSQDVKKLEQTILDLQVENKDMERRIVDLELENKDMEKRIMDCESEQKRLEEDLENNEAHIKHLEKQINPNKHKETDEKSVQDSDESICSFHSWRHEDLSSVFSDQITDGS
eukprot:jgi/Bigna1/83772/fgenesh1_pg.115_\